jgi:hypothetical protein
MRGLKSLLALAVLAAGLGAYIYFVESKKPEGGASPATPKVFTVKAEDIGEITVKASGGEKTTVKKVNGAWQITEPISAPADEAEVTGIVSNLASMDAARTLDANAGDVTQFGLADPRITVGFKTADGKQSHQILIGDKTATLGDLYAMLPDEKKVFLIQSSFEATFNRTTFDLRQKTVLAFDRDKVDRLEVKSGEKTMALTRAAGEWTLVTPIAAPADFGSVESVVGRLQTAQMKAITAQEANDLKPYGLDKPAGSVTVGTGSSRATLLFGGKAGEDVAYAKDESRPLVFTVESSLLDDLAKPAGELRRKDLFTFRSFNATAIDITRGSVTLSFERVKGTGKDAAEKWRQTKPESKDVDGAAFDTFLTKLANLRAASFLEPDSRVKTGVQTPVMVVVAKYDEGRKEDKATFGREGADVFATASEQPGTAKLDATEYDDAVKALDAIVGGGQPATPAPAPTKK